MALSTNDRITSARVWRKRYGAGMRQVGILAAAADYAITHHISDLADDHRRAKALATAIAQVDSSLIDPSSVATNIVGLNLKSLGITAAELAQRTKDAGLLIGALGPHFARLVTHNLTFPPKAGGERAVRVGGVATESSCVVKTICESYAGKPFRPTPIPPDMKAALNALAPYSVGRRDFRIIEEDCSASSPV
jgi:hypothetical protein